MTCLPSADDASQGKSHHRVGLTPDCRTASGSKPQARPLSLAPCAKSVIADAQQVGLSTTEKRNAATASAATRKLKGLTDTPKYVTLGDTAGVASVNGCSQCSNLRFVLLFSRSESSTRRAHNFTGVFGNTGLNFFSDKTLDSSVKLTLRVGMAVVPCMDVDFDFTVTRLAKIANTNNLSVYGELSSSQIGARRQLSK